MNVKENLKKVKLKIKIYDYFEMEKHIEKKYKVKLRDYGLTLYKREHPEEKILDIFKFNTKHRTKWEHLHYPRLLEMEKNPLPNSRFNEETLRFYETDEGRLYFKKIREHYEEDPEGKAKEIPYLDWWHFVLDNVDINNESVKTMSFRDFKEFAKADWQREIAQLFIDEFGEDNLYLYFSW